jgi:hypothetical protein
VPSPEPGAVAPTPSFATLIFMPAKSHKVGDKIRVSMHGGRIVDAVIKAIIDKTDRLHFQIDFGNQQTALVHDRQVVKE